MKVFLKNLDVITIDIGLKGGICHFKDNNISFYSFPLKNKQLDIIELSSLFDKIINYNTIIVVEKQNAFPNQGVCSMFNLGKFYGIVLGLISCKCLHKHNNNIYLINPQRWVRKLKVPSDKKSRVDILLNDKFLHRYIKKSMFYTKRGALLDGYVDSALILSYVISNLNQLDIALEKVL